MSDKDLINFMFKNFNVFTHVNIYIVCLYVYIMNDAFKTGFLQLQKKNSLVPQTSYKSLEVGHNWDSCNAHIPVIIILEPFMLIQLKVKAKLL